MRYLSITRYLKTVLFYFGITNNKLCTYVILRLYYGWLNISFNILSVWVLKIYTYNFIYKYCYIQWFKLFLFLVLFKVLFIYLNIIYHFVSLFVIHVVYWWRTLLQYNFTHSLFMFIFKLCFIYRMGWGGARHGSVCILHMLRCATFSFKSLFLFLSLNNYLFYVVYNIIWLQ